VLLLGVADVAASKRFYIDRGLAVAKSFGRMYVEFATPSSPVKLALYRRRALAKDAGVSPDGSGSHRLVIGGDAGLHRPGRVRVGSRAARRTIVRVRTWCGPLTGTTAAQQEAERQVIQPGCENRRSRCRGPVAYWSGGASS